MTVKLQNCSEMTRGHGVKEHDVCFPGDHANVLLSKAILPEGANASKGLALLAVENLSMEFSRCHCRIGSDDVYYIV